MSFAPTPDHAAQAAVDANDRITRNLIDELIDQTHLYATSAERGQMLAFVARLRAFAPFNALLLHAQKPGLTHAATATDWWIRFKRRPKPRARPLIVLRTMGPVDFVFDFQDTEGLPLPAGAFTFPTLGSMDAYAFATIVERLRRDRLIVEWIDAGDGNAGLMQRRTSPGPKQKHEWTVFLNRNHDARTQTVTLAHELAHMYLGHLGEDKARHIQARTHLSDSTREVEAETVAWLVAMRNGLRPLSAKYLDPHKHEFPNMDHSVVMRAANAVETAMGVSSSQLWKEVGETQNPPQPLGSLFQRLLNQPH